jgi:soluble lytic murein transglycosylase
VAKSEESKDSLITALSKFKKVNNVVHYKTWLAKHATHKHIFLKNHAYPVPYQLVNLPVEPALALSIIRQESVFDSRAISYADAHGLMQLLPSTACEVAKKINLRCDVNKLTRDVKYNVILGSNYLQNLINLYNGSYILAIAAYNGGPGSVNKWIKTFGDPRKMKNIHDVVDWVESIPFHQTRDYVHRVVESLKIYSDVLDKSDKMRIRRDLTRVGENI